MAPTVLRLAERIDRAAAALGRAVAWLSLALVLVQFLVVLMRTMIDAGSIRLEESLLYGHATMFLLAAAWTLQVDGHVRVDILYSHFSDRAKARIDLLGALLLLIPFAVVLAWTSLPYVRNSWAILEHSRETAGLPGVFLLKTLIPVFALLMALQGVSQAIRAAAVLGSARSAEHR